ncbi:MAG TPA: hypothetical protein H9992_00400 [Candidatus Prevotella intestinigallinarum]|nr:hypothetical protein [Candidatus Prevotella intestinigallinarum]
MDIGKINTAAQRQPHGRQSPPNGLSEPQKIENTAIFMVENRILTDFPPTNASAETIFPPFLLKCPNKTFQFIRSHKKYFVPLHQEHNQN